jgi:hypothetical protein
MRGESVIDELAAVASDVKNVSDPKRPWLTRFNEFAKSERGRRLRWWCLLTFVFNVAIGLVNGDYSAALAWFIALMHAFLSVNHESYCKGTR